MPPLPSSSLDVLSAALAPGVLGVTVAYLVIAVAALALAKLIDIAARLCPDRWLWEPFRWAAISIACIDLALLIAMHALHALHQLRI